MRVCLLTEGTYPYVRGGVSTWCHELIRGFPAIDFVVYALVSNPTTTPEYELPPNVSRVLTIPLWGHERLAEYNRRDVGRGGRSVKALRLEFLPLFETLLDQIVRGMTHASPVGLADVIGGLYAYFRENDYDWTMRRKETWDTALAFFRKEPWHVRFMTSLESIELVRSLYRFLIPLALEVPECDVVHNSASGLCGIAAVAASRKRGTPVLLTEHGVYLRERVLELARSGFPFSDRTIKKNFFSAIARAAYACSDVIAPVCRYNTRWEHYYGVPANRIEVVYNGVDADMFPDLDRSPAIPTVAAVLRFDPLKDVLTLIASAPMVRERIPNVQYCIWGPAPDPKYLDMCATLVSDLELESVVRFMGPTRDPMQAYADAHVVALSSISEGFPYAIVEAMMCAKPVVATDVGGVREAVDRYGVVVPPKHPERLGAAIADLLADLPRARELGKEGRKHALAHFTQAAFLEKYRSLYERLLEGAPTSTESR